MKFSQFTELMRQNSQPDKESIRNNVLKTAKPKWIKFTAIICIAVLLIGAAATAGYYILKDTSRGKQNHLPDGLREISTIAAITTNASADRIPTDSVFEITTVDNESERSVRAALSITPDTDYTLKKTSGNTFELKFDSELQSNTLYTLKSMSGQKAVYSWAYQTENKFSITALSPSGGYADETSTVWVEFSHSDVDNFEQYFSITPALSGTFEQYGRRWVFIPTETFELNTVYTVTVAKEVSCGDGQTLDKDCVFSFSARAESYLEYDYLDYSAKCETFTPDQTPGARVKFENVDTDSATVSVYNIATADEFINIHKKYIVDGLISSAIADELTNELTTFEAEPVVQDGVAYFNYPDKFAPGYYISSITFEHGTVYHIFQVTELAVYSVASNGNLTLWVNDTKTEQPVVGVAVTADNGDISATDKAGIAIMNDFNDSGVRYIKVDAQKPYVVITQNSEGNEYIDSALKYYSYINSASTVYRPGDIVKVWGFTLPKGADTASEYQLYCSFTDRITTVTPDAYGAFTAEFEISEGETAQSGYIDLTVDGVVLTTKFFTIDNYQLPTYSLQISTDKEKYIEGDTVTYTVYAELFDGTPAENITVTAGDDELVTNSRGLATLTKTATIPDDFSHDSPYYDSIEFYVVQPDGESVFYHADTMVFAGKTHISAIDDDGETLYVTTQDYESGETKDTELTAELHKVTYEKSSEIERFDPVTMENVISYNYETVDEVISTDNYETTDSIAEIPYNIEDDGAVYYMLILAGENRYTHYISGNDLNIISEYSLTGDESYSVGDTVSLALSGDITEGRVMISAVAGDIISSAVYMPDNISFEFTKAHCPDALIAGAYFDGTQVLPIDIKWIYEKERRLTVDINTDKKSYLPGETAEISLNVTDSDGAPVKANININVIDKALDTLAHDYSDIYDDVHRSVSHLAMLRRTVSTYLTHPITDAYGEGGGGDSAVRTDFEDTPYFESVTTDENGKATVSVTLPDSITSWVIRARAYDMTAAAGQSETEISASKDMFITPYIADIIDPDDETSFAFRVNGKELEGKYEYSAALIKDGKEIDSLEGEASFEQVKNESFGKLKKGKYTIEINVKSGKLEDSIQKTVQIEETKLTEVSTSSQALGKSISADGFESDISVSIYDKEYELYYTVIKEMLSKSSSRIDHRIAQAVASSVLNANNGEFSQAERFKIAEYITDSGICIYAGDSYTTPLQTALITAVLQGRAGSDDIRSYFEGLISEYPDRSTLIAYCLAFASLGEPVLDELYVLRDSIADMTDEQQLYLALGFAYAGDNNTAYEIFDTYLKDKILTANGVSKFSADTPYETEYMTCLATCLTSKISDKGAKDLIKSLLGADDYTVTGLALSVFIENCVPYLDGENTISYKNADGDIETLTYKRTDSLCIKVAKSDIEKVDFKPLEGDSVMTVSGDMAIGELDDVYSKNDDATVSITADNDVPTDGDTVILTVDIDTAECGMTSPYARLVLPHAIKAVNTEVTSESGYCTRGYDQREIEIYLTGDKISLEIECYAAVEGEYVIHAPTLTDKASGQYASGEDIEIEVK